MATQNRTTYTTRTITYEQDDMLDRLLINADMEKKIRGYIKKVLKETQGEVSSYAGTILPNDPRNARKAVRHMVYKSLLGGNVSILQRRKAGNRGMVPSSNRGRSERTEKMLGYQGVDRGFILRFLNAGTDTRTVQNMNNHPIKRSDRPRWKNPRKPERKYKGPIGNRGSITARHWFPGAAHKALEAARDKLAQLIEDEIKKATL